MSGTVSPDELAVTLTHEHLLLNFTVAQQPPTYTGCSLPSNAEVVIENLGRIRHYPSVVMREALHAFLTQYRYSFETNMIVDSEDELTEELKLYKKAGGATLCDVTTIGKTMTLVIDPAHNGVGIRIKPECLLRMSQESGVKIIAGTGYYVDASLSEEVKMMNEDEMADVMVKEIMEGIGDTGVRCGVIGEVGCSWPLKPTEQRALRAAGIAQRQTGNKLQVMTHCYRKLHEFCKLNVKMCV